MSAAGNNLLDEALQLGDVLAAAVFGGNRAPLVRVNGRQASIADLAPVWRHLGDAMDVSAHHRLPAVQMRWIFEQVLVYCIRRSDGVLLGVLVSRTQAGKFDAEAAGRLFEEFRSRQDI